MGKAKYQMVVILGMHRSGTSAITRGLQAIGVELGNNLEPPVKGVNDKGFYEDIEFNIFNEELLNIFNSSWDSLGVISENDYSKDILANYKLRAIELIRSKLDKTIFGIKNPRFAKLLPFWKPIFNHINIEPVYVIANRNPISVAHSLAKRDKFDYVKSYYLWLQHTLLSTHGTRGSKRIVIDYDYLIEDPCSQLKRVAEFLELEFNPNADNIKEFIDEFLDSGLRHALFKENDLHVDPRLPHIVSQAYDLMLSLANDKLDINEDIVLQKIQNLFNKYQILIPLLNYVNSSERKWIDNQEEINTLHNLVLDRDSKTNDLYRTIAERDKKIDDLYRLRDNQVAKLYETLNEREKDLEVLQQLLLESRNESQMLKNLIIEKDNKVKELNSLNDQNLKDIEFFNGLIESHNKTTEDYNKKIEDLKKAIDDRDKIIIESDAHIIDQRTLIANLRRDIDIYTSSTSWRITAPIRQLGDFIKSN